MKKGGIYWTPRVVGLIFVAFLALMSLDVFAPGMSAGEIALGLLMHNIPALILLAVMIISWKYEIVGGITFIAAGILYIILIAFSGGFEWYKLVWTIEISGVAFAVGALFLVGWKRKRVEEIKK